MTHVEPGQVRTVFMGSPDFGVPSLQSLVRAGYAIVAVVTRPDKPAGRGARLHAPPVKQVALDLGAPILQPATMKDPASQAALAALSPDLFVVAAYGQILPRTVLAIPRRGALNVHASLLPRWRGASPITAAILAGDSETGVSIMEMVFAMDAGPVVAAAAMPIDPNDTLGRLEPRLAHLGADMLVNALPPWLSGELSARPQDESLVTTCTLVRKDDGHLRADMTAVQAERAARAYDPWPGAFVIYRGARLAVWRAHVLRNVAGTAPGGLTVVDRSPAVAFFDGLLVLDEVQRSGARRVSGRDFLNGEKRPLPTTVDLA